MDITYGNAYYMVCMLTTSEIDILSSTTTQMYILWLKFAFSVNTALLGALVVSAVAAVVLWAIAGVLWFQGRRLVLASTIQIIILGGNNFVYSILYISSLALCRSKDSEKTTA